jgi:alkylation response protein AidB-like acyl-CoA dehydrogenase
MRLIGVAERALELMCNRAEQRSTFGKQISKHQVVQHDIANCRVKIEQARLLTLKTADTIDKSGAKAAMKDIAMIKVVAPQMACDVVDRAI